MNSLGPKVIQTHLPSIKNPSSKSIIRQSRSTICFCNSDDSGSSSSSSSSEGDKRKQELLARIMMLQTQKVRLTDFLDERSDYLTQFAEDANAEFDEIGNKAMKELDEAGDRIVNFHERTKHIEIDCHYVRERFEAGTIHLPRMQASSPNLIQFRDFDT